MRTIGVVTVARSDYGIYRPVLRQLEAAGFAVGLYVGGMHLSERFGMTVREIGRDGYPVVESVAFLVDGGDSPADIARALGSGVMAFADAFERTRPDILLVLGDRYEMFAAALAALPLQLPLAHLHGGESTEGLIDEAIRHSITKIAHLHFAATTTYARRIVQLGEEPWRVTVSGAPALDEIRTFEPISDAELEEQGIRVDAETLLVTYHPLTLAHERSAAELNSVLGAVEASGRPAIFTYPGADTGYGVVTDRLERFAATDSRFTLARSLGSRAYFTVMARAAAMVGNSSSGIIEAASFGLPVVDVGRRQQGRLRPANVVHASGGRDEIAAALERAVSAEFKLGLAGLVNPYGDGHAGERIAERLAAVELDERLLIKRFHDLDVPCA